MKTKKIFLGGINSVGKTSLQNALTSICPKAIVCYGSSEFMKWLSIKQGDYESLAALSVEQKDRELGLMINSLIEKAEESGKELWVFAGHFGRIKNRHVQGAIGSWIEKFDLIVLLSAKPEVIRDRIFHDCLSNPKKREELINIASSPEGLDAIASLTIQTELIANELAKNFNLPLLKLDSSIKNSQQLVHQLLNNIRLNEQFC